MDSSTLSLLCLRVFHNLACELLPMEDNTDHDRVSSERHLTLSWEDFDVYLVELATKLHQSS